MIWFSGYVWSSYLKGGLWSCLFISAVHLFQSRKYFITIMCICNNVKRSDWNQIITMAASEKKQLWQKIEKEKILAWVKFKFACTSVRWYNCGRGTVVKSEPHSSILTAFRLKFEQLQLSYRWMWIHNISKYGCICPNFHLLNSEMYGIYSAEAEWLISQC